jgi:hypothetical protein
MAYWEQPGNNSAPQIDSVAMSARSTGTSGDRAAFYEIEPGIVLDIILDKDHPYFKSQPFKVIADKWPEDVNRVAPNKNDPDYTWMGRALIRLVNSQRNVEKEDLIWAFPLESNVSEYPLLEEVVGVVFYLGQYYYTKKINRLNIPNTNADFSLELAYGGFKPSQNGPIAGNREIIINPNIPIYKKYEGPLSRLKYKGGKGYDGVLGRYFAFNPRIRALKRHEGDFILESRFGQSIRFGAYDNNRENDKGYNSSFNGYPDYRGNGEKYQINGTTFESGGGNPMILIRNRQRSITNNKPEEKNVGGYMDEDINNDGSSIHITSGATISGFKTTCLKKLFGTGEEQSGFDGTTNFKYPMLMGDQIIINSSRLVLSSRDGETFHYSKKRYAVTTDSEYTVDAHDQVVITTNNKTVINSPAIYLGEYDQTNEPVLLGQTTVNWLHDLCQWMLTHTHWYKHTHPDAGQATPDKTQTTVQSAALIKLRDQLQMIMSRRVFVVGGGLAPGKNGVAITGGTPPVVVTTSTGDGVPGGFKGSSNKSNPSDKSQADVEIDIAQTSAIEAMLASNGTKPDLDAIAAATLIAQSYARKVAPVNQRTFNTLQSAQAALELKKKNAAIRNAAAAALQASRTAKSKSDSSAAHALKSQNAANDAAAATSNVDRTKAKIVAVDEANKAKADASSVTAQRKIAENSAVTAKTLSAQQK